MRRFLAGLLVLLILLVAVDRVGVLIAQRQVADQLQSDLGLAQPPRVTIAGFPVLTQAARGRYDDVRVRLDQADLGGLAGLDADIGLRGAHVPLTDLLSGGVESIPVDEVSGTVSVPYAQVAGQLGDGVTITPGPAGVTVSQTFDLLGQSIPVTGSGQVGVEGNEITVTVSSLDLGGVPIPGYLIDQLQSQLSLRYPIPALPLGLLITSVQTTASGFDVSAIARDVVLDSTSLPPG